MEVQQVKDDYVGNNYDYPATAKFYSEKMVESLDGKQVSDLPVDKNHPYYDWQAKTNSLYNMWMNNELPVKDKLTNQEELIAQREVGNKPKLNLEQKLEVENGPESVPLYDPNLVPNQDNKAKGKK